MDGGARSRDTEAEVRKLIDTVRDGRRSAAWGLAAHVATAADADAAFRALSTAPPRTWLLLDSSIRAWHAYQGGMNARPPVDANALHVLTAACSNDGHVRQAALATDAMRKDPRLLPILVIRTADWVAPVREDARTVLRHALTAADNAALLTAVGVALQIRERVRAGAAVEMVTEAVRDASPDVLDATRASDSLPVRRWAFPLWLDDTVPLGTLVDTALEETDIICRMLCAEAVVKRALAEQNAEPLERMLASSNGSVRAEALTGLVQLGRPNRGRDFLADRSALMRATAQWAVRKSGSDPAELYRAASASPVRPPADLPGLVSGLGECGDARDVERVRPYLRHERPRVRAAAVRAFHRLGGPDEEVAAMLTDPSPVVMRAVTRTRVAAALPLDRLRSLLTDAAQPRHVREGAFRQLKAHDTWTRVEADLLLLATSADTELGERARADLLAWLYQDSATAYATPSPQMRERLGGLVDAAAPHLGEDGARRLHWSLGLHRHTHS